jgi:alkylation response protein AidB-like acyl-CoA dehydrogenase
MDFTVDPATRAFEHSVAELLAGYLTPGLRRRVHDTGTHHDWPLHRAIAAQGWLAAALPVDLGGQGRGPDQLAALFRQLELHAAPYDGVANAMMLGFILGHLGTAWQRQAVLGPILAGDAIPCLGYSEPGAGSDVAAAATSAVRDGEGWVISGQKMFTSLAEEASWAFVLTRTNTEVPKHRGLTFFLVPMDAEGVSVTPVRTLSGKRTNITFYDGVRVDDRWRVGEVDGGWQVMLVALSFERGVAGGVSDIAGLYNDTVGYLMDAANAGGPSLLDVPSVRARLARVAIDKEVADLLGARAAWAAAAGMPRQEGAEAKLFGTEAYGRAASQLLDVLGPLGLLTADSAAAPAGGAIEHASRYAPILTVAGGTSEIQKNLIAERTLGLPRGR